MKKTVKAWAVVHDYGVAETWNSSSSVFQKAIYVGKDMAEIAFAKIGKSTNPRVVPCTITYDL